VAVEAEAGLGATSEEGADGGSDKGVADEAGALPGLALTGLFTSLGEEKANALRAPRPASCVGCFFTELGSISRISFGRNLRMNCHSRILFTFPTKSNGKRFL
jgi:hypothetical protein